MADDRSTGCVDVETEEYTMIFRGRRLWILRLRRAMVSIEGLGLLFEAQIRDFSTLLPWSLSTIFYLLELWALRERSTFEAPQR